MKWMIVSDLHGSAFYCKKVLEVFQKEQADRLLFLGDILYHGPRNDLPKDYNPKQVIAMLNERKQDIVCVRGNCDTEVDQMVLEFSIMAEYCILYNEDKMVFATHGHCFNKANPPMLKAGDILLHGHTHVPAKEMFDGKWYLNPGSVTIPKEGSAHSYMILEDGAFTWKDLEGKVYQTLTTEEIEGEDR